MLLGGRGGGLRGLSHQRTNPKSPVRRERGSYGGGGGPHAHEESSGAKVQEHSARNTHNTLTHTHTQALCVFVCTAVRPT